MLNYRIGSTKDISSAGVASVIQKIKQDQVSFVLFFASSRFDFHEVNEAFHEAFGSYVVLGGTSEGELVDKLGYTEGHLVAISVYGDDFEVEAIVLEEIKRKGMLYKGKVQEALGKLHIDINTRGFEKQFFAISLIDAFSAVEETIITMLEMVFGEKEVPFVGGSCGTFDGNTCYMSFNGKVYQDAALLMFVKTRKKFVTYKENIYKPYGEIYRVMTADLGKRIVHRANGMSMASLYAKVLGIAEKDLDEKIFASNPIGRMIGKDSYLASPEQVEPDGGIKFHTRVIPGSSFRFMQAVNPIETAKETAAFIKKHLQRPKLILAFNCACRHIQFKENGISTKAYEPIAQIAPVFGFTTLGEQIGLNKVNQTLVLLTIED